MIKKINLEAEQMIHWARMIAYKCSEMQCEQCPFDGIEMCKFYGRTPSQWPDMIDKIRKEAADGTQEDNR